MSPPSTKRVRAFTTNLIQSDKTTAADYGASVPADVNSQLAELTARHCEDADFVTALARGIAVMQALADKRRRMSMAQISHITGIPRAAVRRSLLTLSKIGFVAEDDGRRFYLRPKILSLSHAYLSATPLAVFAQPILDQLGEQLQESCSTAVLDGDETVYLARSSSSKLISMSGGDCRPIAHRSAGCFCPVSPPISWIPIYREASFMRTRARPSRHPLSCAK
jgi:hypothetical protein